MPEFRENKVRIITAPSGREEKQARRKASNFMKNSLQQAIHKTGANNNGRASFSPLRQRGQQMLSVN
jgi:hypothetical protein